MFKRNEIRPRNDRQVSRKKRNFKVVLLGENSVGKSSLVNRLVKDQFNNTITSTIGVAYFTHTIQINNNTPVKLEIWDTAGQERFHSLVPMYYRHAQAAIIVYDITDRVSFENAKKWLLKLESQALGIVTVLVGNKMDLINFRRVQTDEAQTFADENYLLFMETSAKQNINVEDIFRRIAENVAKNETPSSNPNRSTEIKGSCC